MKSPIYNPVSSLGALHQQYLMLLKCSLQVDRLNKTKVANIVRLTMLELGTKEEMC